MNMNGYRCIACSSEQAADYGGFLCPGCGGNLDVTYDYQAVARELGGESFRGPNDVSRFSALLPIRHPDSAIPLRIGGTPLYQSQRLAGTAGVGRLFFKDDTANPSASLKDRASAITIGRARDVDADVISVASTGNAGSSLACLAAASGLRAVVFVPASAPIAKLTQMLAFGARVLAVKGTYDDAYDLCLAASREFGWFNRSTGYNPFTREGKKTCAYEIWEGLDGQVPDRVMVSTGDGNTLSAVWKGWCDLKAVGLIDRLPKIDCVQSTVSAAISDTIRRVRGDEDLQTDWSRLVVEDVKASTLADSISVDRPRDGLAAVKAVIQSGGEAVTVEDAEILSAIPEIASATGIFPEPAAAAPWAGLKKLAGSQTIGANETVVCIVSGSGLKDVANASTQVGKPQLVEASLEAVLACETG